MNVYKLRGGDGGRDGVGCDGAVARGDDESVDVRAEGWGPRGSKNGSRLDLSLLQHGFSVCIFVPVRCVTAHCASNLALAACFCCVLQLLPQEIANNVLNDVVWIFTYRYIILYFTF